MTARTATSVAAFAAVAALYTWNKRRQSKEGDDAGFRASDRRQNSQVDDDTVFRVTENCDEHPELSEQWNYSSKKEKFVRWCPKIELHVHLDGSFDPERLYESLLARGDAYTCLPVSTELPWEPQTHLPIRKIVESCRGPADFHAVCTCRGKQSLREMLKCFFIFLPIVRGRFALLEELAFDFVRRQAQQNVIYTEVRYSPHLLSEHGDMSEHESSSDTEEKKEQSLANEADKVVDAVTRGLRRGCEEFSVVVNQILCGIVFRPDWSNDVVRLAQERRQDFPCAVVGIDIAAGEEHFDEKNFPQLHYPHLEAFQKAQELGLNITMHAGEVEGARNVEKAITMYGAKRVGHGYRLLQSPSALRNLPREVHIEVCPTSSVETGGWEMPNNTVAPWTQHPVVSFLRNSLLSVSLSSDDPAVFDTSLTWQWRICLGKMGLRRFELIRMNRHAIDAAFCDEEEKKRLHAAVTHFWKEGQRVPPKLLQQHSFTDRVGGTFRQKMENC